MSDADLTAESWWQREIITPQLDAAADTIAVRLGVPRANIGTKGNTAHKRGSHRSQEWILKSVYCTSRTYTVQSGLTADQARHIAALDITPGEWGTTANRRKTAEITARLVAAMKAGELDEVVEVFGAAPDLVTVTGYNNREDRAASSDDSHLDHVHIGIDRRHLTNQALMERIVSIVMGDTMTDLSYEPNRVPALPGKRTAKLMIAELWTWIHQGVGVYAEKGADRGGLVARLDRVEDALIRLEARPGADVDEAALAALLAEALVPHLPDGADPAAIADAVAARFAAALKPTEAAR